MKSNEHVTGKSLHGRRSMYDPRLSISKGYPVALRGFPSPGNGIYF